jgi:DNA-binding response OmpR family regulator
MEEWKKVSEARVLIVDDDREIARAIGLRLSSVGFKPIMAFDGQQGLKIAQSDPPDAIILDLRMPVMDGFTLLERLQNSVHTRNIPAIILSADAADKARLRALRAGATFFVEKPYKAQDLIEALDTTLERRRQAETNLPFEPRERNAMAATASTPDAGTNRKVLIADDDPAVVRALSVRCKKLGLEVDTAENGLQAILKASRNPPRLLILDINMPEADGFRVCEWLLDPNRPPVDVVMLTGRDDSDTLVRCDSFGAFYVPKNQETWDTIKAIMGEILEIDDATLATASAPRSNFGGEARPVVREKRNKVLIVEDDADLARALERRLQKCGAETSIASNGIEAYRMAMKESPDVIIADYVMPEGGGHYLLWRLKSTESTKHIPVIMITGQTFEPGTEHAMGRDVVGRNGAVKFFRKPLDTDALFRELQLHTSIQYAGHA